MSPTAYRATLDRLGLSQTAAAAVCGVNERTSRNWASGRTEVPEPVQRLLRAMLRDQTLVDELRYITITESE